MSFITRCPHCETSFNITESQMQKAQGIVRCGFCLRTFSALEHQLYLDEIDLGELDLNQASADTEFTEFLHEDTSEAADYFNAEQDSEAPEHQAGEFSSRIPTLEAANEIFEGADAEWIEAGVNEEGIDEKGIDEEGIDEVLAVSGDSDSDHSGDGGTEETGEADADWSGLADGTDDDYSAITCNDDSDDDTDHEVLSGVVSTTETEGFLEAEDTDDTEDREEIDAIGSAFADDIEQEDFSHKAYVDRLEDDDSVNEEADTQYTTEPTKHDSEKEYSQLNSQPQPAPLSTSPAPRATARQKHELQILASLYDDSPLERLDDDNLDSLADEPIAIHQSRQRSRLLSSLLLACNLFLLLGLGAQFLWQHIDQVLLDERFRPFTALLCQTVNCPAVSQFDINQFRTEELIVNAHPQIENALQIDFIFRNNAGYPQAFPRVELNFTDINRRLLANRLFEPEEYLDPELQQFDLLPAGASVQIKLEIADPGPAAINYTLALRSPAQP